MAADNAATQFCPHQIGVVIRLEIPNNFITHVQTVFSSPIRHPPLATVKAIGSNKQSHGRDDVRALRCSWFCSLIGSIIEPEWVHILITGKSHQSVPVADSTVALVADAGTGQICNTGASGVIKRERTILFLNLSSFSKNPQEKFMH